MIPFSLFAIRFLPSEITVGALEMAPDHIVFRLPLAMGFAEGSKQAKILWFSKTDHQYHSLEVRGDVFLQKEETDTKEFVFTSEAPAFLCCLKEISEQYLRLIRTKTTTEEKELPHRLLSYPVEEDRFERLKLAPARVETTKAWIGIEISSKTAYERFLKSTDADYILAYERAFHVTISGKVKLWVFGNSFCDELLPEPELLKKLLIKAWEQAAQAILVLPPMQTRKMRCFEKLILTFFEEANARQKTAELQVNDRGCERMAKEISEGFEHVLITQGILMDRQKKDVRSRFHPGMKSQEAAGETLERMDGCTPCRRSDGSFGNTLRVPFFPMNTALFCTLRAAIENGSRGCFRETGTEEKSCSEPCAVYCERDWFAYPKGLPMIGYGNCLLGLDERILTIPGVLAEWEKQGVQRVILNFPEGMSDE